MIDRLLPAMTRESAATWVRRAILCASAIGCLDLVIWAARDWNDTTSPFRSVGLLDAAVPLVLAIGLWRRSRVAAGLLLAYWVYAKGHQLATTGYFVTPLIGLLVVGWVFLNAFRATRVLHQHSSSGIEPSAPAV